MIITETLMMVAMMDSRIIKRENDFCWLKAIRRAMKDEMFTIKCYNAVILNWYLFLNVLSILIAPKLSVVYKKLIFNNK